MALYCEIILLSGFCFSIGNVIFEEMYVIKVKGIAKIPDYVQLRDEKFTLLAYFRVDRPDKSLEKLGYGDKQEYILKFISELPFGQIAKIDL